MEQHQQFNPVRVRAMEKHVDLRVASGVDGHGDDRQGQGAATSTPPGNARVAPRNGAETTESILTITLREANRIQCKATRERSREKERLLREVRIHII